MMTDDALKAFSGDHLQYELEMVFFGGPLLMRYAKPGSFDENIIKNALLESFVGHVRVLKAFLYEAPKWDDDISADHYVRDVSAWHAAREPVPEELATAAKRAGKEVAHLTAGRLDPDDPARNWNAIAVRNALVQPLKLFLSMARPGVLDWRVQRLITEVEAGQPGEEKS
jgi:hypothetical protein